MAAAISRDLGHGRAEKRTTMVSEQLTLVDAAEGWAGLKSVVCIESSCWINGKEQVGKHYYIIGPPGGSLTGCSADQMACYIHWH